MTPTIINFTPHPVNIVGDDGTVTITIPSSGMSIRVTQETVALEPIQTDIGQIPMSSTQFTDEVVVVGVDGVQQPIHTAIEDSVNTIAIVSRIAGEAIRNLDTSLRVAVPNEMVRDETGRIVGCRSLTFL